MDADDTQVDQPDTPAPIFAMRAFKHAIFGTPAPRDSTGSVTTTKPSKLPTADGAAPAKSPVKPPGILLTPGTGANRRKRVSFGHDVKSGPKAAGADDGIVVAKRHSVSGVPDDCPGKFPSPWVEKSDGVKEEPSRRSKTKLFEVMDRARTAVSGSRRKAAAADNQPVTASDAKDLTAAPSVSAAPSNTKPPLFPPPPPPPPPLPQQSAAEDAWEEVVDDESEGSDGDDNDDMDAEEDGASDASGDVTTDLNEPHSRSGQYWKAHFDRYHAEARAEMERLVRYKQLAKSFAKQKDAEALELDRRLREEQKKVARMQRQASELGRHLTRDAKARSQAAAAHGGDGDSADGSDGDGDAEFDPDAVDELARQTALAIEYKAQVDDLEAILLRPQGSDLSSGDPADRLGSLLGERGAAARHHRVASPRTTKTLIDTQRELRKARTQAREFEKLQADRDRFRSELKFSEQRTTKLNSENRKMAEELSRSQGKAQELEKKLDEAYDESRKKDRELRKLKGDFERLKDNAKARYSEAEQVLQRKNERIEKLEERLKAKNSSGPAATSEPPLEIDLVESKFARLGAAVAASARPTEQPAPSASAVWNKMNTSRASAAAAAMPADRRAAALARLERKRAERQRDQQPGQGYHRRGDSGHRAAVAAVEPNKENLRP